jgi:pilus assembly protein Flp/PilA
MSEEHMKNLLVRFILEDQGQDLIEYGLLIAIITTGAITAVGLIGGKVQGYFEDLQTALP